MNKPTNNVPQPKLARAHANWYHSYADIVLMLLSVIQGFAFQELATRSKNILPLIGSEPLLVMHVLLCFVIIIRVFQTVLTATIDYGIRIVSFIDIPVIFGIGLLQYCLFSALGNPLAGPGEVFNVKQFYTYMVILLVISGIKYTINTAQINPDLYPAPEALLKEKVLQWQNSLGSLLLAGICLLPLKFETSAWPLWIASISSILVVTWQTYNSLRKTFSLRLASRQVN